MNKREQKALDQRNQVIIDLTEENSSLRKALRGFAVRSHVRMASGGGTIPNGGSCEICKTEWREGWPESHRASCLLAGTR